MTIDYLHCAHGRWIDDHCPECEKVSALVERLQERIKQLIDERNALQAEVKRLDPTGDIWQRKESDLVQWRQAYERTKSERDTLVSGLGIIRGYAEREQADPLWLVDTCNRLLAQLEGR